MSATLPADFSAYFLVGPTAAGKTDFAHRLALQHSGAILSADSMLVYRGLDIGTAKPTSQQRSEILYGGIDLVEAGEPFSAGDYMRSAREFIRQLPEDRLLIVTGGTGLYVRCLLEGLAALPAADPEQRKIWDQVYTEKGVEGLRLALKERDPARLADLADPSNPRRLIRALELAGQGADRPAGWTGEQPVITGLRMSTELLRERIARRVGVMLDAGLLAEVRSRRARGELSNTALQAIGYREAIEVLEGRLDEKKAAESMVSRTARLAKRQMTWFRHQAHVEWIDIDPAGETDTITEKIWSSWMKNGKAVLAID